MAQASSFQNVIFSHKVE